MCPDRQIISSFVDGELTGRWSVVIEQHVSGCSRCRGIIEGYRTIGKRLRSASLPAVQLSKGQVWRRLLTSGEDLILAKLPVWKRRISVPIPAMAASLALVLVLGLGLIFAVLRSGLSTMKISTEPSGLTEVHIAAPVQDMERLLAALEGQTDGRDVLIRLPENSEFFIFSEPVLLRAAEYRRRLEP